MLDFIEQNCRKITYLSGFIGILIVSLATLVVAIFYRGEFGERYSFLNHNISELGEIGISDLAPVFNWSLILGGICFVVFMLGFGFYWQRLSMYIITFIGVLAAVGIFFVGVFPVTPGASLAPHTIAALTFFISGFFYFLLITGFFLFAKQNQLPKLFALPSAIVTLSFIAFLLLPQLIYNDLGTDQYLAGLSGPQRPTFWLPSFLEWMILFTVMGWIIVVSWFFLQEERKVQTTTKEKVSREVV